MTNSECKYCSKTFTRSSHAIRHQKGCSKNPEKNAFKCGNCGQVYSRIDYCKKHVQSCPETATPTRRCTNCLHQNCNAKFVLKSSLIKHLKDVHEANIEDPVELTFENEEAFKAWKEEEEARTYSYYSKTQGTKKNMQYYYCQHNGSEKPHRKQNEIFNRATKKNRKGRIKTGKTCIASMSVKIHDDYSLTVKYQPVHCHPLQIQDFQHHPLSVSTKNFIAEQLAIGIRPTQIAKKLQENSCDRSVDEGLSSVVGKNSFVNTHRIHGIALRKRNKMRTHKNDAVSVKMLVEKLLKEENNPIILYKPVDQDQQLGPNKISRLNETKELFMLGIQTKKQTEMLKLGSQKILSVDILPCTNQYGYYVLNLVVPDEYHRGYQVGHLIASHMNKEVIACFFEAVKEKCSDLVINCVITDDNPVIIDGISNVFGEDLRHLLCLWHLHRIFQEQLHKVTPKLLATEMYQALRLIIDCKSEREFQKCSIEFQEKYIKIAPSFVEYFANYFEKAHKWAMCYRTFPHGNIDTTLLHELNNNRLKSMKLVANKRIDDLINMLLEMEEDACTRYQTEVILGIPFGLGESTDSRHKRGLEINDKDVSNLFTGHWEVTSQSKKTIKYKVVRCAESCTNDNCLYMCEDVACYKLCAHLYYCTCLDKSPLCKHIHKVHSLTARVVPIFMDIEEAYDTEKVANYSETSETNTEQLTDDSMKLLNIKSNLLQLTEFLTKDSVKNTLLDHIDTTVLDLLQICKTVDGQEPDSCINDADPEERQRFLSAQIGEENDSQGYSFNEDSIIYEYV